MTDTTNICKELGHDGLVLWQPFKDWAMARNWHLDNMSPNELDKYYDLFKAGHDYGQQALVAENESLKEQADRMAAALEKIRAMDFRDEYAEEAKWIADEVLATHGGNDD